MTDWTPYDHGLPECICDEDRNVSRYHSQWCPRFAVLRSRELQRYVPLQTPCDRCDGDGRAWAGHPCGGCDGTGVAVR